MTIVEFLKARLDEAEKHALASVEMGGAPGPDGSMRAQRQLAEIEAKRRIVGRVEHRMRQRDAAIGEGLADSAPRTEDHDKVLNHLAMEFSGHPDYNPLWRPRRPRGDEQQG